jgi:hypothetical protein
VAGKKTAGNLAAEVNFLDEEEVEGNSLSSSHGSTPQK